MCIQETGKSFFVTKYIPICLFLVVRVGQKRTNEQVDMPGYIIIFILLLISIIIFLIDYQFIKRQEHQKIISDMKNSIC